MAKTAKKSQIEKDVFFLAKCTMIYHRAQSKNYVVNGSNYIMGDIWSFHPPYICIHPKYRHDPGKGRLREFLNNIP